MEKEYSNDQTKFCKFCGDCVPLSEFDLNARSNPKRYCRKHNHLRRRSRSMTYRSRNVNLKLLGFNDYNSYLRSDLWKDVKIKYLDKREKDVPFATARRSPFTTIDTIKTI